MRLCRAVSGAGEEGSLVLEQAADTMMRGRAAMAGIVVPPPDSRSDDVMHSLDRAATAMLSATVRKLKQILSRHVSVSTQAIAARMPGACLLHSLGGICGKTAQHRIYHVQAGGRDS